MIEIRNVSYSYQAESTGMNLQSINMKIEKGECILLCGKSGCGKTTMTRLLNGMIPNFYDGLFSGEVLVDGREVSALPMHEIARKTGSVFQNPRTQFYTVNTSAEIAFGLENMGIDSDQIKARVSQTAADLGIEHLLDKSIFMLSGGEKQIIAFASVYAMDPDIYVMDEPSSNLDAYAIEKIRRILELLKKQGKTIVIAEHRIYYLQGIADRVILMENGSMVQEYSLDDISAFTYEQHLRTGLRMVDIRDHPFVERRTEKAEYKITLKDVKFRYEQKLVLDIPGAELDSGRITAIIGNNGAGKSTFVSCLCGLEKKVKGSFFKNDRRTAIKSRVKDSYLVMQEVNHQLFSDSVYDEIVLGIKDVDEAEVGRIMAELDISQLKERHPATLSGGQKQRVLIASAMFCKKKVLIFDEPTSGLDFYHMVQTCGLLKKLKKKDTFLFIITHDYEFIANLCDDVIHLEAGEIRDYYRLDNEGIGKLKLFGAII